MLIKDGFNYNGFMDERMQLRQLYKYDQWANKKIVAAFSGQLFDKSKKCQNLFAHIRAAQQIWFRRIHGDSTSGIPLWPEDTSVQENAEKLEAMHAKWLELLNENSNDLNQQITYKNSKGTKFDTGLAGILHHVIIHGQHHRAQIASLLRQGGIEPPGTDFIFFLREMNNK